MKKISVLYGRHPIIDIETHSKTVFGIYRDRMPDSGWNEIQMRNMDLVEDKAITEVDLDDKWKQILLEDLAYCYGKNSSKFRERLLTFGFITPHNGENGK